MMMMPRPPGVSAVACMWGKEGRQDSPVRYHTSTQQEQQQAGAGSSSDETRTPRGVSDERPREGIDRPDHPTTHTQPYTYLLRLPFGLGLPPVLLPLARALPLLLLGRRRLRGGLRGEDSLVLA